MKYLSVCSGIEAATVAWHPLGWEPAAFCEIEAFPSAVLAHRYPNVPNYGDFTRLTDAAHPIHGAGVDLLVGGTPCQAFSVAGLRQGLADPRGGLTLEFVRLAQALRPRWIVWENVPGVLSQDGGRAFGAFLGALGELGYGWAYRVLDAQYVRVDGYPRAVPQRRRRVFVVACAGGQSGRAGAVLFEPEGMRRDTPPSREAREGAAAAARPGAAPGGGERGAGGAVAHVDCMPTMVSGGSTDASHSQLSGQLREQYIVPHIVAPPLTATNDPSRSPQSSEVTLADMVGFQTRGSNIDVGQISGTMGTNSDRASGSAPMVAQTFAHVEVVGTLSDGAHNGGGLNGQDAYTGRILPVVPYDLFQVTEPSNRQNRDERSPCHTLARDNAAHAAVVQPLAFDARQHDVLIYGEKSGPLNTDGSSIGVCVTGYRTHALRAEGADASEDGTGRGTPIVTARSVALRGRDGGATAELGDDLGGCLRASTGGGDKPHVLTSMSVRRLTPVECERLQGFPDGWTAIPWKGKPASECPDGPRYKALGNSMACNVMRWIGRRIEMVGDL